jgi:quercetin 2,3-dioxygenase
MEFGAEWTLPPASKGINRTLYYYEGEGLSISGISIPNYSAVELQPDHITFINVGNKETSI